MLMHNTNCIQSPASEYGAAIRFDLLQWLGQSHWLHTAAIENWHLQLQQRYVMNVLVLRLVARMYMYGCYPSQLAGIAVDLITAILHIQLLRLGAAHTMRRCQYPTGVQQCCSTRVCARLGTTQ